MSGEVVQEGTGNYLKIAGGEGESYSDKIFSYQGIRGFLPVEVRRINGKKEYLYDISGKVSLGEYFARGNFDIEDMKRIFRRIFDMEVSLEEYLLDSQGLVIREDFLFFDKASGEVEGIYRDECEENPVHSISRLLETIMEKMNQKDKELVLFVYGMHKRTKETGCTCGLLREYVEKAGSREELGEMGEKKEIVSPAAVTNVAAEKQLKGYILPGTIAAVAVIGLIAMWWLGIFQKPLSGETDWTKTAGIFAFLLAIAGYGIWKTIPRKSGSIFQMEDEERTRKNVCLIPRRGGEPIAISYFPFTMGKLTIMQEAGGVYIVDEEADMGIIHNEKRLVPWQKTILQDGDILLIGGESYVAEITQPGFLS